jgi:diguanylate cyclase (GGDEF)-like protein/PAS domain S-box-containing protein
MIKHRDETDHLQDGPDSDLKRMLDHTIEHFRAIVEGSDDAIISKTLEGIVTSWNPGATRLFGYSADEMVGQKIDVLLPPDRKVEEQFILERIAQGELIDHFETVRMCKDHSLVQVSVTISPIRNSQGAIVGASKIARNITLQKQAQAQLKLIANVFTSTSEGILIAGADGLIIEVNGAFSKITGFTAGELIGQDPQKFFRSGPQGPSAFRTMRGELARTGEWKGEIWSRRKDGQPYSVLLTVTRTSGRDGTINNYVAVFSDITSLRLQQEQLEYRAHYDALTSLPNRLLLSDRLQQSMINCRRNNTMLAVLYMDLDGFKNINDSHGHAAGDELLIATTKKMKSVLREGDTLARIGGDEFVAVLTGLRNSEDCNLLLDRFLEIYARPFPGNGIELSVTASIGVTLYPNDEGDMDQLIRHADYAMYEAKSTGKNRYVMFDALQDAVIKNRIAMQLRIDLALDRNEFVLHYQPKINMRTGAVVGLEALIRWPRPDNELLPPGSFLPLIENHAIGERLDAWVLETVLHQMDVWRLGGLTVPVSINVGARFFQSGKFTSTLSRLLTRFAQLHPENIDIEILETSALKDIEAIQHVMRECHALGIHFSIDDFGTGYSTLTYLKKLAASTLKIDQSFVRDILVDGGDLSIVKGVIGLANAFNLNVIAEGVESHELGIRLILLGCEQGQGNAIARAMPSAQAPAWIDAGR